MQYEELKSLIKDAMKAHDKVRLSILRQVHGELKNIEVDEPFKVIPGMGVYAVWVEVEGKRYKGMLYIGDRPTLHNGKNISLEVHILDFSGDIYNNRIRVAFLRFIREAHKFNSLEELKAQLERYRETVE